MSAQDQQRQPPTARFASSGEGDCESEKPAARIREWVNKSHLQADNRMLGALIATAALLFLAAGVGMAYVSGFGAIRSLLGHPHVWWIVASGLAEAIAFIGYGVAYRGMTRVERGPKLSGRTLLAVVSSGFGGFIAQGGGALDHYALKAAGASDREASARVAALGGLEHGTMPFIVCPTAIFLLVEGVKLPPGDFTVPWAVIPPIGFAIGVWCAERFRDRLRDRGGWRGKLAVFLDGVHYVWCMFRHPIRNDAAVLGMLVFWGATIFSMYAGMAAFGYHMSVGPLIVAFGVGYFATQRTAPLGGAGLLMLVLPPCLLYAGAPLAAATLGVFVHRFFSLWMFMPLAVAGIPRLRALGQQGSQSGEGTGETQGEPVLQH